MPVTKKPTSLHNLKPRAKAKHGAIDSSRPLKPTKWGVDLLVKIEAFREALAAQK
jgi:hypothetical protein